MDDAEKKLKKKYGASIIKTGAVRKGQYVPSGSLELDRILGGGWCLGRMYEIFGSEGSGKTTICIHAMAEAQKMGLKCLYIDAEHAIDSDYATVIGVDWSQVKVCEPPYGEVAMEVIRAFVEDGGVQMIVCDTVAALTPKAEKDGEIADANMALLARMMSKALRVIAHDVRQNDVCILFINQVRANIGVMFGEKKSSCGGNALKHYASGRVRVSPSTKIDKMIKRRGKEKKKIYGRWARVDIQKLKTAPPFGDCMVPIIFGKGIDVVMEYCELAYDILDKKGNTYLKEGEVIAKNKKSLLKKARGDEELFQWIKEQVIAGGGDDDSDKG